MAWALFLEDQCQESESSCAKVIRICGKPFARSRGLVYFLSNLGYM